MKYFTMKISLHNVVIQCCSIVDSHIGLIFLRNEIISKYGRIEYELIYSLSGAMRQVD